MRRLPIALACQNSDRTRPLIDGRVTIEGVDLTWLPVDPEEIFHRAFREQEFEVCELSLGTHLVMAGNSQSPYVGVPAFLSRVFRHSAVYIRKDRGINSPADLKGRKIGLPDYQQTAALWVRGMLSDEYGVKPTDVAWRAGGLEQPGRTARTPITLPASIDHQDIPADKTLSGMLASGEIDAIISPRVPSCMAKDPEHIGRLFPDYRSAEEAYFTKTGFFPLMHCVGIRRELHERHPWLAASLMKAFVQAKAICMQDMQMINYTRASLPWLQDDVARVQKVMGSDYWRYGIQENMGELKAMARYAHEDGLIGRLVDPTELFASSTAAMFKI